jgi:hypothetical protein
VFKTGAERSVCAMKVAARIVFFKRSGSDDDAVDFDGGARRDTGDGEFVGGRTGRQK